MRVTLAVVTAGVGGGSTIVTTVRIAGIIVIGVAVVVSAADRRWINPVVEVSCPGGVVGGT